MKKIIRVNGNEYKIIKLLGHGKGGYSYLALSHGVLVVLKQIHHEPCDFYTFGNKVESEKHAYRRLKELGIRIPTMLAVDLENQSKIWPSFAAACLSAMMSGFFKKVKCRFFRTL